MWDCRKQQQPNHSFTWKITTATPSILSNKPGWSSTISSLFNAGFKHTDIGVAAPYDAMLSNLRRSIDDRVNKIHEAANISSCSLSMARLDCRSISSSSLSLGSNLGFMDAAKCFGTAMTRGRMGLVLIGTKKAIREYPRQSPHHHN